ncbi:MAG: sensor histidine kinase, partial [Deltaproteobacteria bacterium]
IRNPIAGISGTLQVIVNGMDAEDGRAVILGRVQEQVHRLDRLVRDLLQYSRPCELAFAPTTLRSLAEEGLRQAAVDAELEVLTDHELLTDAGAVQQILVNLLQNARDAAGDTGWVGLRVGPGRELWVMDDGPGVPHELRDTLFRPFVSSKAKGTGLGLAICERRAQEVGGTLDLVHGPMSWPEGRHRGAAFRLRLPAAPRR